MPVPARCGKFADYPEHAAAQNLPVFELPNPRGAEKPDPRCLLALLLLAALLITLDVELRTELRITGVFIVFLPLFTSYINQLRGGYTRNQLPTIRGYPTFYVSIDHCGQAWGKLQRLEISEDHWVELATSLERAAAILQGR